MSEERKLVKKIFKHTIRIEKLSPDDQFEVEIEEDEDIDVYKAPGIVWLCVTEEFIKKIDMLDSSLYHLFRLQYYRGKASESIKEYRKIIAMIKDAEDRAKSIRKGKRAVQKKNRDAVKIMGKSILESIE